MREKIEIPDAGELDIIDRVKPNPEDEEYLPYKVTGDELVPPMAAYGGDRP